ncbi:hypothetical protein AK812_SmicGene47487, partial [Symbiodinium microadriaticum]
PLRRFPDEGEALPSGTVDLQLDQCPSSASIIL